MQAKPKCPPLGKFTVGWIAALHCEYLAAKQVLDVEYTPPAFYVSKGSGNVYTFGRIGEHHVVIATLGRYGTLPAVAVLNGLQNRFPFLQFVLMVGVAGGVPTGGDDIRLGDVVVANQMVPYSVNKKYPNAAQFNGVIVLPGEDFLSAAAKVRVMIEGGEVDLENIITEKFAKNERIRDRFRRPEDRSDRLYQPGYEHTSDCDCDCLQDESRVPAVLVTRPERKPYDRIRVHCGAIGSADCVVRDAIERDRLARQFKLLCFEMESAGLMANFPCLPIRGICDYSDSHKNKGWQGYAAAVAAAFALSLLHVVPHQDWQAAGHHIDAEALRQHMEQVFESVMHVMSPPGDGETLTLEGARQALDEIRDTVDKLDQLSESRTQELRETTQSAMGKSAAEIDQAKSRLNQIEVEQKHMRELLEELRGKIAQQHEKSPQEEREKWNTVHSEAQKNSTWLKERSESTTAALESTAGILSHVGELTNNTDITRTGRQVNGATGIARRVIDGVERVTKKWGGNRASPSTASPKANSATKHQCVRKEAPVRRLPPPFAAQFAQKPSHACLGGNSSRPPLPPRNLDHGSQHTSRQESPPELPPRPPRSSPVSHLRPDIPTPDSQSPRVWSFYADCSKSVLTTPVTVTELYQEQIQRDLDPTTFVVVIVRTLLTPSLEGPTFNSRKVSPSIRRASRTAKTTSQTRPS